MKLNLNRCPWADIDDEMRIYHDQQWGVPVHNDQLLFEMLNLEGAQAGLSWLTILKRRSGYVKAFDNFDANKIIKYDEKKLEELLKDTGIIRNRLKINAVVTNAKAYFVIKQKFGSLDKYLWGFVGKKHLTQSDHEEAAAISQQMSQDLKKYGFKFIGPTICYALMQSVGLMNDHVTDCFRYQELQTD